MYGCLGCDILCHLVHRYQYYIPQEHTFNIDCCKKLRLNLVYLCFQTVNIPFVAKVKDGTEYWEYQSDDVQDNVYLAVLQQSYKMFRLFKGSFTAILNSNGADVTQLKQKLDHFFSRVRIKYFFLHLSSQDKLGRMLFIVHIVTSLIWFYTVI